MKFLIINLSALLILFSCNENGADSNGAQFKASINNVDDNTEVYLGKLGQNGSKEALDTTTVKSGKFSFDLADEDFSTLNIISLENIRGNMMFINNQQDISATLYKDSLRQSKIDGGKENELLTKYFDHLYESANKRNALKEEYSSYNLRSNKAKLREARRKMKSIQQKSAEFRKEMVKENPESLVSALILTDLMQSKTVSTNELKDLYAGLSDEVQRSSSGQAVQNEINSANATSIGAKAPSFSAKTPEGNELSLEESLGEYTILDFWASWCKPCRMENPHLVKIYEKYHPKGLNILSVSLDKRRQRNRWLNAIERDNMTWQHVSNLQFWRGPIVQQYNVHSIPATFILDSEGKIVAKDLRGAGLDRKMEELFGE